MKKEIQIRDMKVGDLVEYNDELNRFQRGTVMRLPFRSVVFDDQPTITVNDSGYQIDVPVAAVQRVTRHD